MSDVGSAGTTGGQLGERRLGTIHAVAQALAIGPMFSTALVLGGVSNPATGSGFNAALAVLVAGLGVLAIAYTLSIFARRYAGAGAVYEYLTHGAHPAGGVFTVNRTDMLQAAANISCPNAGEVFIADNRATRGAQEFLASRGLGVVALPFHMTLKDGALYCCVGQLLRL